MKIRRALVTDVFELSRLWAAMAREAEPALTPDLEMWRGYVVGLMKYQGYFMFVAEDQDRLIGMIDYAMQPDPGRSQWKAVGNFFYVLPEYRGGDVAKQLWDEHEKSARENNAKELSSTCLPDKLDYWEKHGFDADLLVIRRKL